MRTIFVFINSHYAMARSQICFHHFTAGTICFDKSLDKIRKYVVYIYTLIFDIGGFICSFKGG